LPTTYFPIQNVGLTRAKQWIVVLFLSATQQQQGQSQLAHQTKVSVLKIITVLTAVQLQLITHISAAP
jgi:hypothetical protein